MGGLRLQPDRTDHEQVDTSYLELPVRRRERSLDVDRLPDRHFDRGCREPHEDAARRILDGAEVVGSDEPGADCDHAGDVDPSTDLVRTSGRDRNRAGGLPACR